MYITSLIEPTLHWYLWKSSSGFKGTLDGEQDSWTDYANKSEFPPSNPIHTHLQRRGTTLTLVPGIHGLKIRIDRSECVCVFFWKSTPESAVWEYKWIISSLLLQFFAPRYIYREMDGFLQLLKRTHLFPPSVFTDLHLSLFLSLYLYVSLSLHISALFSAIVSKIESNKMLTFQVVLFGNRAFIYSMYCMVSELNCWLLANGPIHLFVFW